MKISESWLREWVNPALLTEQLAAKLTMAGLEVDGISPVAGPFTQVIVAQVRQTKPHPDASRLTVCEVDAGGKQMLQVVCGAKNVRAGLKVALAQIGAKLPNDLEIKETTLRGELSQGMLCSSVELGLSDNSEGIIELAADAPVGVDLRVYLSLDDHVLDIDLTPNRADCLSVLGVARELAALSDAPLKAMIPSDNVPTIKDECAIVVQAAKACPQYCGRIIKGVNSAAKTPLWMTERLRRAGIRAIHPVVDVTNYVMLELGQPMHAFNLEKIHGGIMVRFAHPGEELVLLDESTAVLMKEGHQKEVLVIADEVKVLAIAGVMGGAASAVDEQTTDIFLESAFFSPLSIAGVARSFGLTTESSQRFERGIDPTLQRCALERATALLLEITGGKAGPITGIENQAELPKPAKIIFNPQRVKQLVGIDLPLSVMKKTLGALGMDVQVRDEKNEWLVLVPAYRFDITLDVDLIEEIVRVHGYDEIAQEKMIVPVEPGVINPLELLLAKATQFFINRAYNETITYSFVDPKLQELLFPDAATMNLLNPISSELSSMRVSLWPGLIASMLYNYHRQHTTIKLFETGVTFVSNAGVLEELPCLAGLIVGELGATDWLLEKRSFDFYDLKGDLQALFASLQLTEVEFRPDGNHPALHPGKSAQVFVQGRAVGWCGVLHPLLVETLDLSDEVILFEVQLPPLMTQSRPRYKAISKFPFIRRDLSLLVNTELTMAEIERIIKSTVDEKPTHRTWLKSLDVFDVYVGEGIPADKKSLAVSLVLQDESRTLVDSEINDLMTAIIKQLEEKLAITLRD